MPRICSICTNADRGEIDSLLVGGTALSEIAALFRVSDDALSRHKANHLSAALLKAREVEEVANADGLLGQVRDLQQRTLTLLEAAENSGERRVALAGVGEARRNLALLARLTGELEERSATTVNVLVSPQWIELRAVIVGALKSYPDARGAVLKALEEADNGNA